MKVSFHVEKTTALKAGKDRHGDFVVEVPADSLTPAQRETLAKYDHNCGSSLSADFYLHDVGRDYYAPTEKKQLRSRFSEATPENVRLLLDELSVVDAVVKARESREKEEKAALRREKTMEVVRERKTEKKEWFAWFDGSRAGSCYYSSEVPADAGWSKYQKLTPDWPLDSDSDTKESEAAKAWLKEIEAANEAASSKALVEAKANYLEMQAKAKADAEAKVAADTERDAWIQQHGSTRLKRMLEEGIERDAAYRDERLAADRSGWRWERKVPGQFTEPRNPPEEAFSLLDEARKVDPKARLVYWTVDHEHEEDGYCNINADGEDCPEYDWTGYAAVAEFLGREIVYGGPS